MTLDKLTALPIEQSTFVGFYSKLNVIEQIGYVLLLFKSAFPIGYLLPQRTFFLVSFASPKQIRSNLDSTWFEIKHFQLGLPLL